MEDEIVIVSLTSGYLSVSTKNKDDTKGISMEKNNRESELKFY